MAYEYSKEREIKKMFDRKMAKWDEKATHIRVAQSVNIAVELVKNHNLGPESMWELVKELVPKIHRDLYWLQKNGVELEQREEEKAEEALRDSIPDEEADLYTKPSEDNDDSEVAGTLTLKEE